jgi:hypothetical protein
MRMGLKDLGYRRFEVGWKLAICSCRNDLVTCAAPGSCVRVEKQKRGGNEDYRHLVHWGRSILLGPVQQSKRLIRTAIAA